MKFVLAALWILAFALAPASAMDADDSEMIVMTMTIYSNGEIISTPQIAFDPGTDASVMQELDAAGLPGNRFLELEFHPVHLHETGPEILLDVDSGLAGDKHVEARLVVMTWNQSQEFLFPAFANTPGMRIVITPSLATRSEYLSGRRNSG